MKRRARLDVPLLLSMGLVLGMGLACGDLTQPEEVPAFLPVGLAETLPQLEALELKTRVVDLGWLAPATGLEELAVFADKLEDLSGIPSSVDRLSLNFRGSLLTTLDGIPEGLSSLRVQLGGSSWTDLSGLPAAVPQLALELGDPFSRANGSAQVSTLDGIPDGTRVLELGLGYSAIEHLQGIPSTVERLHLALDNSNIQHFTGIPSSVQDLEIHLRHASISSLATIPASVQRLTIELGSAAVPLLSTLPETVRDLRLSIHGLPPDPSMLPAVLSDLELSVRSTSGLDSLPPVLSKLTLLVHEPSQVRVEAIPEGVSSLVIQGPSFLSDFAGLPGSVSELSVSLDPATLEPLETLPASVTTLNLTLRTPSSAADSAPESSEDAPSLTGLRQLPATITEVSIKLSETEVESLEGIPETVSKLTVLPVLGSSLTSLRGIPESVSELIVDSSVSNLSTLEGIPRTVSDLTLTLAPRQIRDLHGIPSEARVRLSL